MFHRIRKNIFTDIFFNIIPVYILLFGTEHNLNILPGNIKSAMFLQKLNYHTLHE